MTTTSRQLVVPIHGACDRALFAATVLAPWLEARLQVVAADDDDTDYQSLAAGLGLVVEPTVRFGQPFHDQLLDLLEHRDPSLIVTADGEPGRLLADTASHPVLLVSPRPGQRLPTGPLVVDVESIADLDVLAVGGLLAAALDTPVRLVVTDPDGLADGESARDRLQSAGAEVEIDVLEPRAGAPDSALLADFARSRSSLAVVMGRESLTGDLVDRVLDWGGNVLVVPPGVGIPEPADRSTDRRRSIRRDPATAPLQTMSRDRCREYLASRSVARLAYVDGGWPVVVPVNYRLADDLIVIRSQAGGKVRAAERRDVICLELDGLDDEVRSGWSVVVHGRLEPVSDPGTLRLAWANDPEPWVESDDWHWLALTPISISGRMVEQGHGTPNPVPWWPLA